MRNKYKEKLNLCQGKSNETSEYLNKGKPNCTENWP